MISIEEARAIANKRSAEHGGLSCNVALDHGDFWVFGHRHEGDWSLSIAPPPYPKTCGHPIAVSKEDGAITGFHPLGNRGKNIEFLKTAERIYFDD